MLTPLILIERSKLFGALLPSLSFRRRDSLLLIRQLKALCVCSKLWPHTNQGYPFKQPTSLSLQYRKYSLFANAYSILNLHFPHIFTQHAHNAFSDIYVHTCERMAQIIAHLSRNCFSSGWMAVSQERWMQRRAASVNLRRKSAILAEHIQWHSRRVTSFFIYALRHYLLCVVHVQ